MAFKDTEKRTRQLRRDVEPKLWRNPEGSPEEATRHSL